MILRELEPLAKRSNSWRDEAHTSFILQSKNPAVKDTSLTIINSWIRFQPKLFHLRLHPSTQATLSIMVRTTIITPSIHFYGWNVHTLLWI